MKAFWKMLRRRWRVLSCACGISIVVVFGVTSWANNEVCAAAHGRVFDTLDTVPAHDAAIVLGCSRLARNGRGNLFFIHRLDAAAALYKAGKVRHVIVSGDNHVATYDEATDMWRGLVERGVPATAIHRDYAGFSTLDSVVRAKAIFGQTNIIVVSQRFQNERAIYIAQHRGIDAIGYNAAEVHSFVAMKVKAREYIARCKAVLDVNVFNTQPKFFGPPILLADEAVDDQLRHIGAWELTNAAPYPIIAHKAIGFTTDIRL